MSENRLAFHKGSLKYIFYMKKILIITLGLAFIFNLTSYGNEEDRKRQEERYRRIEEERNERNREYEQERRQKELERRQDELERKQREQQRNK